MCVCVCVPSPQLRIASVNGAFTCPFVLVFTRCVELFMFSQKSVAKVLEKFDQQ